MLIPDIDARLARVARIVGCFDGYLGQRGSIRVCLGRRQLRSHPGLIGIDGDICDVASEYTNVIELLIDVVDY